MFTFIFHLRYLKEREILQWICIIPFPRTYYIMATGVITMGKYVTAWQTAQEMANIINSRASVSVEWRNPQTGFTTQTGRRFGSVRSLIWFKSTNVFLLDTHNVYDSSDACNLMCLYSDYIQLCNSLCSLYIGLICYYVQIGTYIQLYALFWNWYI